jgi:hypothetical protein
LPLRPSGSSPTRMVDYDLGLPFPSSTTTIRAGAGGRVPWAAVIRPFLVLQP